MQAFGIAVLTEERQEEVLDGGGYRGSSLQVVGHPQTIALRVRARGNGVTPIAIYGSQICEYPEQLDFMLRVPVTWKQQGSVWIPNTRERGKDNVDIILVDSGLHFKDVQVSLLSRKGRFYAVAQVVYEGWMRVVENEVRFIPSNPAYAYPGADYLATWKGMGSVLATMTRVIHGILDTMGTSLEDPTPATWEPQEVAARNGWSKGHVLFFNPITNTGRLLGEDGFIYHVYGNDLVDVEGPIHMLEPMTPVYFRPGVQQEGQAFTPVRSCRPA
ncbi:MAG: hypothetical protein Q7R55_00110 [Candidatus Wildermuthbacteria bacterium]|nr:hypothetical protein [Candidatus Wildermuthbacteria bacterium]